MSASSSRLSGKTLKVNSFLDEFEKDDVKRSVDIISLFSHFGIQAEKKGRGFMANCPWHEDSTPSLSIDQEKGLYNCFGCGESGDAFDLVKKVKGIEFKEALVFLKEYSGNGKAVSLKSKGLVGSEASRSPMQPKRPAPPVSSKTPAPKKQEEPETFKIDLNLKAVTDYYSGGLVKSKEAMKYLESRGFDNPAILTRFGIGFASGDLSEKVSSNQKTALTELGIFTEKGREAFTGCITIPLLDASGQVVGLYGRKIAGNSKIKHLYLKGPHKGLFNRKAASVYREEIILTESILDSLSLIQQGIDNTIPMYGTNGFTDELLDLLKSERVKTVVLALDSDEAGKQAFSALNGKILEVGIPVKALYPPAGKDWNEYLTLKGTKEQIKELLSSAEVFYPKGKSPDFLVETRNGHYFFTTGGIRYRLAGVKELFVSSLRVNVRAEKEEKSFIDNADLYSARSRTSLSTSLSRLFDVEAGRVERDLVRIVEYLESERDKALGSGEKVEITLTEEDKKLGMELLTSPKLFDRIVKDTETLGYVGEDINKMLVYIAASSRKLDDPISVIVMSESAAGKSYLIDTVKKLIPAEDVVSMTSLSDQALNYLPEDGLLHKFLVMGEAVHSEVVEHQIREMLSAHELSRLVTTKDEKTGAMVSRMVRKDVIVSAVMSSTDYDLNAENTSRSFVVNTDESTEQTRRIHSIQKQKYSTLRLQVKQEDIPTIIKTHHAAQRLLKKIFVVNPLAERINFPANNMRSRRDHDRFMDLIASIAFLRQYQKEEKEAGGIRYIECDQVDLEVAVKIIKDILPATLTNFPKSAMTLYEEIRTVIQEKAKEEDLAVSDVSVGQREIRERTGLSLNFVRRNIKTLCEYEYLIQSGSRIRGGRSSYRLVADEAIELLDLSRLLPQGNS